MSAPVSIVVPARNAGRTIGAMLDRLASELMREDEVILVDDGSLDDTVELAGAARVRVIATGSPDGSVGAARNLGWEAARHETVVFLDADALVDTGWRAGLARALDEFEGAVIGCARGLTGRSRWSWVAQLQVGTPWLATGEPREVRALPSFCLVVPKSLDIRWDPRFGGEDGLFAADVLASGRKLVFDPRFHAVHEEYRDSFSQLRAWQRRLAYGMARCGPIQREGAYKRVLSRVPLHYFALLRLPRMYVRLHGFEQERRQFVRLLPWLIVAEWSLGVSALRYAVRRPPLRSVERLSAAS
jgi:glycosyltransferase involved in cell wall biosynthesis